MMNSLDQLTAFTDEALHDLLQNTLQTTFQLQTFRQGQLEALTTLIRKRRLLCIQPTGHGKSLLYQIPAFILPGITIVLSPLLALMRDQIQQLNHRFNIPAASINSDQSEEENNSAQENALQGRLKILFVAPEKLESLNYFNFLLKLPINLIVVDEAHCISTWGHDFRPSYRQILHFIHQVEEKNNALSVLAITATANQKTEQDIIQQLSNEQQQVAVQRQSLSRPNLQLDIIQVQTIAEKLWIINQLLQQLPGHGLIYCATRENTELVANYLKAQNYQAVAYHAGLHPELKQQLQQEFINNHYQVIAATNALGMGIDKADLRFIIHFDVVGSITAYYQEIGRAGRDGLPARAILLFDAKDKKIQQHFIDSAQPHSTDFDAILQAVDKAEEPLNLTAIKCKTGLHPTRVTIVLAELLEQGYLYKTLVNKSQVYQLKNRVEPINFSRFQQQLIIRQQELGQMLDYGAEHTDCLMGLLRKALGDQEVSPCGQCCCCIKTELIINRESNEIAKIAAWLSNQVVTIDLGKMSGCVIGTALFDGKLRLPLFVELMKNRQCSEWVINPELVFLIKAQLINLQKQYSCSAIVVVPSNTWVHRDYLAKTLANILNLPLYLDALCWRQLPACRQGECLNNDQRRQNVTQNMIAQFPDGKPSGPILLVDDYIGSGATLKEAARTLKKDAGIRQAIIPFTLASVRWKLGQRGMI